MARTALNAETLNSQTTRVSTFTAAIADGHMATNDGLTFLRFKNTNAAARTVTVLIPATLAGVAAANGGRQHVIPALTGDVMVGPFPTSYSQPTDGRVWWDYSATADLTVAVVKVVRNT